MFRHAEQEDKGFECCWKPEALLQKCTRHSMWRMIVNWSPEDLMSNYSCRPIDALAFADYIKALIRPLSDVDCMALHNQTCLCCGFTVNAAPPGS